MIIEMGSLNVAQDVYVKIGANLNNFGKWYEVAESESQFDAWTSEEYQDGIREVAETLEREEYGKPSDVAVAYKKRYGDRFCENRTARWLFVQAGYENYAPVAHEHFTKGGAQND